MFNDFNVHCVLILKVLVKFCFDSVNPNGKQSSNYHMYRQNKTFSWSVCFFNHPLPSTCESVYLSLTTNKRQITCNLFLKTFQHYLIFTTNANVYLPKLEILMKMAFRITEIFFILVNICIVMSIIWIISGPGTGNQNAKIECKDRKHWWEGERLSIVSSKHVSRCHKACTNFSDPKNSSLCQDLHN